MTDKPTKTAKTVAPKKKRKKKYLNNADLLVQLAASNEQGRMNELLAHMLQTLTARYASQGNFAGYSYVEDMKAYAMYMICRTWHRFDKNKSNNPFAFFTQCIKHSFYQFLNKEKRQRVIRDELLVYSGMNPSNTYISDYEETLKEAKKAENVELMDAVDVISSVAVDVNIQYDGASL